MLGKETPAYYPHHCALQRRQRGRRPGPTCVPHTRTSLGLSVTSADATRPTRGMNPCLPDERGSRLSSRCLDSGGQTGPADAEGTAPVSGSRFPSRTCHLPSTGLWVKKKSDHFAAHRSQGLSIRRWAHPRGRFQ